MSARVRGLSWTQWNIPHSDVAIVCGRHMEVQRWLNANLWSGSAADSNRPPQPPTVHLEIGAGGAPLSTANPRYELVELFREFVSPKQPAGASPRFKVSAMSKNRMLARRG